MVSFIHGFENVKNVRQKFLLFFILAFLSLHICTHLSWAAYEEPPVLRAKSILSTELLKGENHAVQDKVINDGLFNHYTVETRFGTFKAASTGDLIILLPKFL